MNEFSLLKLNFDRDLLKLCSEGLKKGYGFGDLGSSAATEVIAALMGIEPTTTRIRSGRYTSTAMGVVVISEEI